MIACFIAEIFLSGNETRDAKPVAHRLNNHPKARYAALRELQFKICDRWYTRRKTSCYAIEIIGNTIATIKF